MKKILVGVDTSETALRAARRAAELAGAFDAELHVVSAFSASTMESIRTLQSSQHDNVRFQALEKLMQRYRENAEQIAATATEALLLDAPELQVVSRAVEGSPAAVLLREAEEIDADLIVVGNKRVQGITRVLGSIARTVSAEASCDLFIVNTHRS
ncbi:MAG TPA: universal stress protein [Candidatus Nesterenkonia stercoripullorum]|uniref:Universal stress protein n=1 Tax=Candidatus Nesterenkonia stercoripullorum TaxID=2838701 RepID=A0A9D1UTQ7_9MICC|nr:universal stress protein [Candidatus Nesterenkonia stercoripullorum]